MFGYVCLEKEEWYICKWIDFADFTYYYIIIILVYAGLFKCFHNPLNSGMNYMIFNVHREGLS